MNKPTSQEVRGLLLCQVREFGAKTMLDERENYISLKNSADGDLGGQRNAFRNVKTTAFCQTGVPATFAFSVS